MELKKLTILIPVFNDFESLNFLFDKIVSCQKQKMDFEISFVIVNDNSSENELKKLTYPPDCKIEMLHLVKNMGHQRAIAVGLSYIAENIFSDYVVVMDADGEDKPEHIQLLFDTAEKKKKNIIFAERSKRQESLIYRMLYSIYKLFFTLFTGKTIKFGNFCIIPYVRMKNIVHLSEIWIHFSGAIINSKIPYSSIPLEKGKRIFGKSNMKFTSLIIHGLSAMAVNAETLIVRLLIFSLSLIILSFLGILLILSIKLFSTLAIPGWATSSVLSLLIIFIQAFFMSLLFVFFILNRQTRISLIPIQEYSKYIYKVQIFNV